MSFIFSLSILSFQLMKRNWPSSEEKTTVSIKQIPKVPGDHNILLYSVKVKDQACLDPQKNKNDSSYFRILICAAVFTISSSAYRDAYWYAFLFLFLTS